LSPGGETIKFEIWDTAGQERYHSLAPMYYRGAKAAIVVFDITSRVSFEKARNWVAELQQSGSPNMVIALAGNKCDLAAEREVSEEDAKAFAVENRLIYLETSAKGNINVHELFHSVASALPRPTAGAAAAAGSNGLGQAGIQLVHASQPPRATDQSCGEC